MSLTTVPCRVCGASVVPLWQGKLRDVLVQYYECMSCGYIQTEQPHWLDRAYTETMNASDTGIMARNQANAKIVLGTLLLLGERQGNVVDFAGGHGVLVRLLRDYGIDALWADRYAKNLFARGFEYKQEKAKLVTAFEAFEHFTEPLEELKTMLQIAPNVLISTELVPHPTPRQTDWWYYGKEHGQHIGFFRKSTLDLMAKKTSTILTSGGSSYHLFSEKSQNEIFFKIMLKLRKCIPLIARHKLSSRTLTDHERILKGMTDD